MPLLPDLLERLTRAIETSSTLDRAAEVGQKAASLIPAGPVKDLLSGTWIGHPLHPVLVTVPIGAFTGALALDVTGDSDASRRLIGFGLLSSLPTMATGMSDWADTQGAERRVGLVHAASNVVGLSLLTLSWVSRQRGGGGRLSALAGYSAIGVGGWLGGHLSYALGVGVDTTAFSHLPTDWTDACADTDLMPGKPLGVDAGGVPVLLLRQGTVIRAISDRCTHRGAPLHEGEIQDGCVVCPWHDSSFDLTDGSVQRGPATRPQQPFETRVVDGRVQVRHDEARALRTNPVH
ncbi:MAG TPA: Rieske 2Fe-2S domain-containing protein [Actinomycetales bacterium]|jgi:nitrite reductase/ring-hydroxylating ferredoxin subunit/uncharacterized membrane protein